jgi:nicotinamide riboside kinase
MSKCIAIVGAHGCGKSTLVLKMAYEIKLINTKLEVALSQESLNEYLKGSNDKLSIRNDLVRMIDWSIDKYNDIENKKLYYDVVISDRSPLDSLIYNEFNIEDRNHLIHLTRTSVDEIYLIEVPDHPVEDNGYRIATDDREYYFYRMKELLEDEGFKYRLIKR